MHRRISHLTLITASLLLSLTSPLSVALITSEISSAFAQTPTNPNRKAEAYRLNKEGLQQLRTSQFREALQSFQKVLAILREIGDKQGEGAVLSNIGEVYRELGEYAKALEFYQQALAIAKQIGDQAGEGITFNNIGLTYRSLGQYAKALEFFQQALAIHKKVGDRVQEGTTLNNIGLVYRSLGQYPQALEFYQQALTIRKQISDKAGVGNTLSNIGVVYGYLGQYPKALEFYQQALAIRKQVGDKAGEGTTLNNIGAIYDNLGEYAKALDFYQQALAIRKQVGDQAGEGTTLSNIGNIYDNLSDYPKALDFYQQSLAIAKRIGDQAGEGNTLNKIGGIYLSQGEYAKALDFYQQALAIAKQIGDRAEEGATLNNIALVYDNVGDYPKALDFYQQALAIRKQLGDKAGEGTTLNNMGGVYKSLGENTKALNFYQQALAILKQVGDQAGEGITLNNIGLVYDDLAEYPKALDFYQQSLAILKKIGNKAGEGITLNNIGLVYDSLGEYPKALEFYQQALAIAKQVGDRKGEGQTLNNMGLAYRKLNQYPKALDFYTQALAIRQQIGDKEGVGTTLNNIAGVYYNRGEYPKALDFYQQALAIRQQIGDKAGEGTTLNNIGALYYNRGEYPKALDYYQQALAIVKEIGDKAGEGLTLNNIGVLLEKQNQAELATVFLKQSVNVTEEIRKDLRVLPQEQQQSYTKTVAETYRRLADLLLKQNRIAEARQVLDLLKLQEIDDYLENVRGNQETSSGVDLLTQEPKIFSAYEAIQGKEIQIGKELTELRKICQTKCTPTQEKRIAELDQIQQQIRQQFNQFINSDTVKGLVKQLNQTAQEQNLRLANLNSLRNNLQQDAVVLYPLISPDRLELVLVSPHSPPVRRTVAVKPEDLNRAIVEFRHALEDPLSDAKIPAVKLYELLIKPIESDLAQAQAKTIIYAPDGILRYVPLAALHDGKSWLVERFGIHNITAASIDDLSSKRQIDLRVLAAAFTEGRYSFQVGSMEFDFAGLAFAGKEVDNLAATIKNTTKLLDNAFSRDGTVPKMGNHNVVHLATHAAFVAGNPDDSFILFGNGDRVTLRDVQKWNLPNVDLIVLSACETGVGDKFGNGEEILGFGYLMQQAGAKAAIASLWSVDDGGTQALMDAFYAALQNPNSSKAESIRQAQVALISGNYEALGKQRGIEVQQRIRSGLPPKVSSRLSHPFYWAPFILIGNGL